MGITPHDISNIDSILNGEGDWFTANLLRLMGQADSVNIRRLAMVYPMEFIHFCKYKYNGAVPREFSNIPEVRDLVNEMDVPWRDNDGKLYGRLTYVAGRDF